MGDLTKLQNFVFRGILLNETLGDLANEGLYLPVNNGKNNSSVDEISLEDFSAFIRMNAIKMSNIYTAFFCFENTVRELVSNSLREKHGSDWWEKTVSTKIKNKVTGRIKSEETNRWHEPRGIDKIAYADFGDLSDIIMANWADFEHFFPDQDWVRNRISDLEHSRNVIAHNNILSERDILRIKSHLGDWLRQLG